MSATQPPTLDTVASLAGVSRQTVSNALHRPDRLRPATRARVEAAIDELGYRPSIPARQLATRRATAIAVPAHRPQPDGVSGLLLDAFLHGLADACLPSGHRVILYPAAPAGDDETELIADLLLTGSADAVVLTATHPGDRRAAWLGERRTPFCSFGRPWDDDDDAVQPHDWVDVDGADGCDQAVSYLAARGCRRIAYVGWPGGGVAHDRRSGWHRAATRLGVMSSLPPIACDDVIDCAETAVGSLLESSTPPDALVCASDTLALGAWRATRSMAEPPLIVGFDATPVTTALAIPSVAQPVALAARTCHDLVLARLGGSEAPFRGVLLSPELRLPNGRSTARAPR